MGTSQIIAVALGLVGAVAVPALWRWDGRYHYSETFNGVVVEEGERESSIPPHTWAIMTAVASVGLLAVASSEDVARRVLPTAALALVGVFLLRFGVSLWRGADGQTARIERAMRAQARDRTSSVSTAFQEGPVEGLMQGFSSWLSPRAAIRLSAAIAVGSGLGLVVLAVVLAVNDAEIPAAVISVSDVYLVVVDVVELVGYGALTLILLFLLVTADRETPVGFVLAVLAFYAIGIGLGLWLGWLDGWIDIIEYVF